MSSSAALAQIADWPVDTVAAAIIDPTAETPVTVAGDPDATFRLASLSKPMSAWAILVAVEEGTVGLDDVIAPFDRYELHPGTTLRHLLAHAAGLPFEGTTPVGPLERRRIYSNTGIEVAAAVVETAAEMPFGAYLSAAIFEPLGMIGTALHGSPAHAVHSTVADVARFVFELLRPTLLDLETARTIESIQYPSLAGIVPGVGSYDPCPWGLGIEIKGDKHPHWMGADNSARTVGHFGGAGTMMWADPAADCGAVALTDRPFDQWAPDAMRAWERFSNAVIHECGAHGGGRR